MSILAQLASDDVLDSAYQWLCQRRRDYSANSDVWNFRRRWQVEKQRIEDELRSGNDRFPLLSRITLKTSDETDLCALAHRERAVIWNGRRPPGRASAMLQAVLRSRA